MKKRMWSLSQNLNLNLHWYYCFTKNHSTYIKYSCKCVISREINVTENRLKIQDNIIENTFIEP
jgi:hypothetical protein